MKYNDHKIITHIRHIFSDMVPRIAVFKIMMIPNEADLQGINVQNNTTHPVIQI